MKKGLLIIISGPSGVGKGTVRNYLMNDKSLNLAYSVSCTTRSPRQGEKEGVDYFYITKDEFIKRINENRFLEYTQYCGNYYGTLLDYVDSARNNGLNMIVEIETNGAKQVISKLSGDKELSIFITAPSFNELENRIRKRATETEEKIRERLEKAKEELKLAKLYDYVVVNTTPEECALQIKNIIDDKLSL